VGYPKMKERFEDLAVKKKQKAPGLRSGLARVFSFCLVLTLCIPVAVSEGREQGKVVFFVGGAPHELEAWESLVKDFERESGINVGLFRQLSDTTQRWISAAQAECCPSRRNRTP
jgi:hypothetical protein